MDEVFEEQCSCLVCSETFSSNDARKMLKFSQCTHILCRECLVNQVAALSEEDQDIICPMCEYSRISRAEATATPEIVEPPKTICNMCELNEASIKCKECQANLCSECDTLLHKVAGTKSHCRCPIEGEFNCSENLPDSELMCGSHKDKVLDIYCLTCGNVICDYCCRFGDHKDHQCDLLANVVHGQKMNLKADVCLVEKEIDGMVSLAKKVKLRMEEVLGREKTEQMIGSVGSAYPTLFHSCATQIKARLQINLAFDAMVVLLNNRRQELLHQIDVKAELKAEVLHSQLKQLNIILADLYESVQQVDEVMEVCVPCTSDHASHCTSCAIVTKEHVHFGSKYDSLKQNLQRRAREGHATYYSTVIENDKVEEYPIIPCEEAAMELVLDGAVFSMPETVLGTELDENDEVISQLPAPFIRFIQTYGAVGGPDAPVNVKYKLVDASHVEVTWEMPKQAKEALPIQSYIIFCIEKDANANTKPESPPGTPLGVSSLDVFSTTPPVVNVVSSPLCVEVGRTTVDHHNPSKALKLVVNVAKELRGKTLQYVVKAVDIEDKCSAISVTTAIPVAKSLSPNRNRPLSRTITIPSAIELQFSYHGVPFDDNGVIYWIATKGKTARFVNPHQSGLVVATMSSVCSGAPYKFVGRVADGYNYTNNTRDSWMSVDLSANNKLVCTGYCLRSEAHSNCNKMRNWSLQGKNATTDKDSDWVTLNRHDNDLSLSDDPHSVSYWPVAYETMTTSYRYFRILQHGKGSSGYDHLMCCGIELYGLLATK